MDLETFGNLKLINMKNKKIRKHFIKEAGYKEMPSDEEDFRKIENKIEGAIWMKKVLSKKLK